MSNAAQTVENPQVANDNNTAEAPKITEEPGFFRRVGRGIKAAATSRTMKTVGSAIGQTAYAIGVTTVAMVATGAIVGRVPSLAGRGRK